ncbi:MAG TPA: toxin PIN [Lachnospiraceae bacterium]|nr:toxin PIN [Lachnospiraceae bacterium]
MRILIDTNVLADVLLGRDPYYDIAYDILTMCADKKVYGYIAAHSIPNLFYILRKSMTKEERREALKDICQIVKVEGIDSFKIISALDNEDFVDFEDCLQEECAAAVSADYIVTRNTKDFVLSRIPAILPDNFLERYKDEGLVE